MASDLDILILQPDKEAKPFRVSNNFLKESRSPCKKHVVSSARRLILSLYFYSLRQQKSLKITKMQGVKLYMNKHCLEFRKN